MIKILFVTEAEDDYWCVINLNHEVFYNLLLLGITLCVCSSSIHTKCGLDEIMARQSS